MSDTAVRGPHVVFTDTANDDCSGFIGSSSPTRTTLVSASSSGSRPILPLAPARTVSLTRRGVIFSPRHDTKYFHSSDSILPAKSQPPSSIRSYVDSDQSLPDNSPSLSRSTPLPLSDTPPLVRSILKTKVSEIRIASSVEEGTLNNKEAARLLVSGKRPKLLARDSFQLAMMRKAASEGVSGLEGKGKGKEIEDAPGSDDSASSDDSLEKERGANADREGSSDEEEETVEEDGALSTGSLISIILDGAEDLLTLEEAYSTLGLRLRSRFTEKSASPKRPTNTEENIRIAIQPIRDEAPAMVRAIQRDLQRLMGKVPNSEVPSSEADSSPFRGLMPLRDSTPINRHRVTPSPTPAPQGQKQVLDGPVRQGYTESEVRYRREASGVGAAALRFLAYVFHTPQLYRCFTEADLSALLDQVMTIPRTPRLPTPNPKRSYYLSIFVLAQMNVPAACVQPAKEKIARAVESAINDTIGNASPTQSGPKEAQSQTKKEGFQAVINLLSTYPAIFVQHYSDFLPACLKGMSSPIEPIRQKASAAAACFAEAKITLLSDLQAAVAKEGRNAASCETWQKARVAAAKSEIFVVSHLRSALRIPGKATPVYGSNGEKKTEASALEQVFKDAIGQNNDVAWACGAWAIIVSLLGSAYSSSGLAVGFDHIMERSLQASNNLNRPPLARIAWQHAVHAYLINGLVVSISDEGKLVQSFKPFAASGHQDANSRLATIRLPVDLAIEMASGHNSASRVLQPLSEGSEEMRYAWVRTEKEKRHRWMITCGQNAAGLVYAYSGMALLHEEQPAKEMTAISGLPSSDGAPMPESMIEDAKMERLDKVWEKVVAPILGCYTGLRGVDRLKSHGWAILAAITSSKSTTAEWSLDRLLAPRYLTGEAFGRDKDNGLPDFIGDLEADTIKPTDISSWGSVWIVKRLDKLLTMFNAALSGVHGISDPKSVKWIKNAQGELVIPLVLSRVWCNLLRALVATTDAEAVPQDVLSQGLMLLTRHLAQIFNLSPASYLPVQLMKADGTYVQDVDTSRICLFTHLFDAVMEILGKDVVGGKRICVPTGEVANPLDAALVQTSLGLDANGLPTMAGSLLGMLLKTKALSFPLQKESRTAFKLLVAKVLDAGLSANPATKLLGDMTNRMPWIFEDQEEIQLDVWRLLATTWTATIDLQPSATANATNHTGALLVSLLSGPFRGRQVTSIWHQHADQEDLAVWQALLKATILRFRAKRVGSNLGVLESLAGHLGDFLEQGEKTSSTTITLSCLAAATSWISFVPPEHYHAAHFINENHVPTDFLNLISNSLVEAYPGNESASPASSGHAISPAVSELIDNIRVIFGNLPGEFVEGCLEAVQPGLSQWMSDEGRYADETLGHRLDELYVTVLNALANAVVSKQIPAKSDTLDKYIDVFAPRLSRALSADVPRAFQAFWRKSFQDLEVDFSDDVRGFLLDVLAAVPGMIEVRGLLPQSSMSEEESIARFPNAQILASQPTPSLATAQDNATAANAEPAPTAEYDADISLSLDDSEPLQSPAVVVPDVQGGAAPLPADSPIGPSPNPSDVDSERNVSDVASPAADVADVFGSSAVVKGKVKGKKRAKRSRPLSEAYSMPEAKRSKTSPQITVAATNSLPADRTLVPETENEANTSGESNDDDDTLSDIIVVPASAIPAHIRNKSRIRGKDTPRAGTPPVGGGGILSTASRWIERVSSWHWTSPTKEQEKVDVKPERTPEPGPGLPQHEVPQPDVAAAPAPADEQAATGAQLFEGSESLESVGSVGSAKLQSQWQVSKPAQDRPVKRTRRSRVAKADDDAPIPLDAESGKKEVSRPIRNLRSLSRSSSQASKGSIGEEIVPEWSTQPPQPPQPSQLPQAENQRGKKRTRRQSGRTVNADHSTNVTAPKRVSRRGIMPDPAVIDTVVPDLPVQVGVDAHGVAGEAEDEEDELLLSPETAKRRRKEEQRDIVAAAQARGASGSPTKAGPVAAVDKIAVVSESQQSGRFDDAPEDTQTRAPGAAPVGQLAVPTATPGRGPTATPIGRRRDDPQTLVANPNSRQAHADSDLVDPALSPSSASASFATPARTPQGANVLAMVENAAGFTDAIENLDFQGVMAFLGHVDVLRAAAMSNLENRARREREKRAGKGKERERSLNRE